MRAARPGLERHLNEAHRIGRVRGTDNDHDVHLSGDAFHGALTVLGGVADVIRGRVNELREALTQTVHGLTSLIDGQGGLGDPHDTRGVAHDDSLDLVGAAHDLDVVGSLTEGSLDLLVALMPHENNVVVLLRESHGLAVHLGHERARRVDRGELAGCCGLMNRR